MPFWIQDPLKGGANFECPPFPPRKRASLLKAGDGSRDRLGFRHSDKKSEVRL